MSFDPMAAAIDWLDAYRSSDLEFLLSMFADDAVVQCGCCAMTTICLLNPEIPGLRGVGSGGSSALGQRDLGIIRHACRNRGGQFDRAGKIACGSGRRPLRRPWRRLRTAASRQVCEVMHRDSASRRWRS
jgi:hypothetical protein